MLFGGISIYLQQSMAFFRKTPRFLDRLWDSPAVIGAFASRSLSTDPKLLGDLMISMLEGDRGVLRKEFEKLLEWVADEPVPDVINLPNSLLISLAAPLRAALQRPIVCTLQGEDLFLDGLLEPYRSRAMDLTCFASGISRESRRKKGCTRWPRPTRISGNGPENHPASGSKPRDISVAPTPPISNA